MSNDVFCKCINLNPVALSEHKKFLEEGFANGGSLFGEMDLLSSIYHRYAWALLQGVWMALQCADQVQALGRDRQDIGSESSITCPFGEAMLPKSLM